MPPGFPLKKYFVCRKCEGSKFKTFSDLRKHQWARHREVFAKLDLQRTAIRKKSKRAALVPMVSLNGDMRVSDLLDELTVQQRFITDVVALVSSILERHQAKKEAK